MRRLLVNRFASTAAMACVFSMVLAIFAKVALAYPGELLWSRQLGDRSHGRDGATGLVVDAWGNSYVGGTITRASGRSDCAIVKYNSAGVRRWIRTYDAFGGDDGILAVKGDYRGTVYVAGSSYRRGRSLDMITLRYNAAGRRLWAARYDGPAHLYDYATAVDIDRSGYVYTAGGSDRGGASTDVVLAKYTPTGRTAWIRRYDDPSHRSEFTQALVVDGHRNSIVLAVTGGWGSADFLTIKYDVNGKRKWLKRYDGGANLVDLPAAVAADSAGHVFVTGYAQTPAGRDVVTIKYSRNGAVLWTARYDNPLGTDDEPLAIKVDPAGNVYVAGSTGNGDASDSLLLKYTPGGVLDWSQTFDGDGHGADCAYGLSMDTYSNVYVAGYSTGAGTLHDAMVLQYSPAGVLQWIRIYNGAANGNDEVNKIGVRSLGVYAVGSQQMSVPGTDYDFFTVKCEP